MITNKILKELWDKNAGNLSEIEKELHNIRVNEAKVKDCNKIFPYLKQGKDVINKFTPLDVLTVNSKNLCYYKQWQVPVYESTDSIELNYVFNLIAANLSYNLTYNEEVENVLDYYNLGNELRQMGFFSLEGNIIFFNASVYMANPYNVLTITNPQVKLEIFIRPFLNVKR